MLRWPVQLLLMLAVVAQGGCLRACQFERVLVGDADDAGHTIATDVAAASDVAHGSPASCVATTVPDSSEHGSGQCPCEFRKGLAQPERVSASHQALALDFLKGSPRLFDASCLPLLSTIPPHVPAATVISHSPPLLI